MANKTLDFNKKSFKKKEKKDYGQLKLELINFTENESLELKISFRHLSTNEILALSFRDRLTYKKHVKSSMIFFLENDKSFSCKIPFKEYSLEAIVGTGRGRDLDSFGLTIKPFLDSLEGFYIESDSFLHMKYLTFSQIIGEGFFIIFKIRAVH